MSTAPQLEAPRAVPADAPFLTPAMAALRNRLEGHRLYSALADERHVRALLEHHVFCVWDFMLLLKSLQRSLTCIDPVWTPRGDPALRRLVNEIVLAEETDEDGRGGFASHLELYLQAMREAGADTGPARTLLALLDQGVPPRRALEQAGAPRASRAFCAVTLDVVERGRPHEVAAAFTLGREEPIPAMFVEWVGRLAARFPDRFERLRFYLERHVELDGDHHGPLALRLLSSLCGDDPTRWAEATAVAERALAARLALWDAVAEALPAT